MSVEIRKPDTHRREYAFFELPNALKVVVGSDAKCDKAGAALTDCTDREINAVDSEFQAGVTNPFWRDIGILNMSANPDHPFHVACGNNKMLRDDPKEKGLDLYEEMQKFYDEFYSANGMTLFHRNADIATSEREELARVWQAVAGQEAVREEEVWRWAKSEVKDVVKRISVEEVRIRMATRMLTSSLPAVQREAPEDLMALLLDFLDEEWNRLLLQAPVKDVKSLKFSWVIPWQGQHWRSKPVAYLSHLLGHEGAGSLCFGSHLGPVSFTLTDGSVHEVEEIGKSLFTYIGMLQAVGVKEWILAAWWTAYGYATFVFLKMSNWLKAKVLEERCTERDTSYDSPMKLEELPDAWRQSWTAALNRGATAEAATAFAASAKLRLPPPNPFIPEDLDMKAAPSPNPTLPRRLPGAPKVVNYVFHRQDDALLMCIIRTPFICRDATSFLRASLWSQLVQQALSEFSYDAEIASCSYSLDAAEGAIMLSAGGFHDKLGVLIEAVTAKMLEIGTDSIDPRLFSWPETLVTRHQLRFLVLQNARSVRSDYFNWLLVELGISRRVCEHDRKGLMRELESAECETPPKGYSRADTNEDSGRFGNNIWADIIYELCSDECACFQMLHLCDTVAESVPENFYNLVADRMADALKNQAYHSRPLSQASRRFTELTRRGAVFPELVEAFEANISRESIRNIVSEMFSTCHAEALVMGNETAKDALDLVKKLETSLGLKCVLKELPRFEEAQLPPGRTLWMLDSTDKEGILQHKGPKTWLQCPVIVHM
eukprot:s2343_g1.t1